MDKLKSARGIMEEYATYVEDEEKGKPYVKHKITVDQALHALSELLCEEMPPKKILTNKEGQTIKATVKAIKDMGAFDSLLYITVWNEYHDKCQQKIRQLLEGG